MAFVAEGLDMTLAGQSWLLPRVSPSSRTLRICRIEPRLRLAVLKIHLRQPSINKANATSSRSIRVELSVDPDPGLQKHVIIT